MPKVWCHNVFPFVLIFFFGYCGFFSLHAQQPTITSNPSDGNTGAVSVCEGEQITFLGSWSGVGTVTYEFLYRDSSSGTVSTVQARSASNTYSETLGQGILGDGDEVSVRVYDVANNPISLSSSISLTILSLPTIPVLVSSAFNNVFCEGESVSFYVDNAVAGVSSYTFYINGVRSQGPSNVSTFNPSINLNDGDQIRVEATNVNGCSSEGNVLTMTKNVIDDVGAITFDGVSDTGYSICEGETPVLMKSSRAATIDGVVQTAASTSYQWYSSTDGLNWSRIPGATSEDYQASSLFRSTYFRRGVMRVLSVKTCEESVDELYVEVLSDLELGSIINGGQTVCAGTVPNNLTLINDTPPAGKTYSRQWQSASIINGTYADISGATGTTLSFSNAFKPTTTTYYRVAVTVNPDGCTEYTNPVVINVEQEHTLQQLYASSLTQEICYGAEITPIVFEFGGGATDLIIEPDLSNHGLTATLSNTNQYIITGTPSGSLIITFTTTPTLGNACEAKTVTYTIVEDPAPTLPDNIIWRGEVIWSNGTQIIIPPSCPTDTSETFTGVYFDAAAAAVNEVEWELVDTGPPNPGFMNPSTGELTWTPSFTGSALIRARGKSNDSNCSSSVSEWSSTIQVNRIGSGSSVYVEPYDTIEPTIIQISNGVSSGPEPQCEITSSTLDTQYVASYSDGSEGLFVQWSMNVVPLSPLDPTIPVAVAGSISPEGLVNWAPGFWGSVEIIAIATDCASNTSSPTARTVNIPENTLQAVDISIASGSSVPNCPDSTNGATTQFVSNLSNSVSVTWSIDTVSAGTMNANTGLLTWASDFSGGVWVRATTADIGGCQNVSNQSYILVPDNASITLSGGINSQNVNVCSGDAIADIEFLVEGAVENVVATGLPAGLTQTLTERGFSFDMDFTGSSSNAGEQYMISLSGQNYAYVTTSAGETGAQVATQLANAMRNNPHTTVVDDGNGTLSFTWLTTEEYRGVGYTDNSNISGRILLSPQNVQEPEKRFVISGIPTAAAGSYPYSVTTFHSDSNCGTAIVSGTIELYEEPVISLTSAPGTDALTVCNDTAISITYAITGVNNASIAWVTPPPVGIQTNFDASTGVFSISGTPDINMDLSQIYEYTISARLASGFCNDATYSGSILINPNETLELTSTAGTNNQDVCSENAITPITYAFGGGASSISLSSGSFPPGITGSFQATKQIVELTVSGNNTLASGEIYNLIVNGITYPYTSVSSGITPAFIANQLATVANANPDVTVTDNGNGKIILEALTAGSYFTVLTTTASNSQATMGQPVVSNSAGIYTITGSPTIQVTTPTTYTYVLSTNGSSCSAATVSGTITLNPSSRITLNGSSGSSEQAVCDGTAISNIVYDVSNEVQGAFVPDNQLPDGVSYVFNNASKTLVISGTPAVNSIVPQRYYYTVKTIGNSNLCLEAEISGSIIVEPNHSIQLTSSPGTDSQEVCKNLPIQDIVYEFDGGATNVELTAGSFPPGISGIVSPTTQQVEIILSGATTLAAGEAYTIIADGTSFTVTSTAAGEAFTSVAGALATSVNTSANISAVHDGSGKIILSALSPGYYFTTFVDKSDDAQITLFAPVNVTSNGIYTISGTPTENLTTSKTYSYTLTTSGGGCGTASITGEIVVKPLPEITLASAIGSNALTTCDRELMTPVEFQIANGSQGAVINWLSGVPTGIQTNYDSGTGIFSIIGTPATGIVTTTTYDYEITSSGSIYSCNETSASGFITIEPAETLQLVSAAGTDVQQVCLSSELTGILPLQDIVYEVEGATGVYVTGLPTGLSSYYDSTTDQVTISGAVTNVAVSQIFTYTINTLGPCQVATATGTIEIVPPSTLALSSGQNTDYQIGLNSVCDGASINPISYTFGGGATNVRVDDLPAGLNWIVTGNTVDISGILAVGNEVPLTFEYSVSTLGSLCTKEVKLTGQIEVNPLPRVDQAYVIANDITNLSCKGSRDGSIVIPSESPAFDLRISGDQNSIRQIDHVYLFGNPNLSDVFTIQIGGISYTHTVIPISAGGRNQNAEEVATALADEINQATGNEQSPVTATLLTSSGTPTIVLSAKNAGTPFTVDSASVTPNSSPTSVTHATITANRKYCVQLFMDGSKQLLKQ